MPALEYLENGENDPSGFTKLQQINCIHQIHHAEIL